MQLFYTQNISGQNAILSEDEAKHVRVLRKNINDLLYLIDGSGFLYEARITALSDSKKTPGVSLEILSRTIQPKSRNYHFHLYIAPTKQNERIEWMLEKAIESGLDEITFIHTEHSEKSRINAGRLEKIAISAMKQSGEYYLPKINDLVLFEKTIRSSATDLKLLAHCNTHYAKHSLKELVTNENKKNTISIFIGPEGDFTEKEIQMAYAHGFRGLSLGTTRLRTETAGLYAAIGLSVLQ